MYNKKFKSQQTMMPPTQWKNLCGCLQAAPHKSCWATLWVLTAENLALYIIFRWSAHFFPFHIITKILFCYQVSPKWLNCCNTSIAYNNSRTCSSLKPGSRRLQWYRLLERGVQTSWIVRSLMRSTHVQILVVGGLSAHANYSWLLPLALASASRPVFTGWPKKK